MVGLHYLADTADRWFCCLQRMVGGRWPAHFEFCWTGRNYCSCLSHVAGACAGRHCCSCTGSNEASVKSASALFSRTKSSMPKAESCSKRCANMSSRGRVASRDEIGRRLIWSTNDAVNTNRLDHLAEMSMAMPPQRCTFLYTSHTYRYLSSRAECRVI